MTTRTGKIVINSRPTGLYVYLDGEPIRDSSGKIAKTPTIVLNVTEGIHNVTFSKPGYDDTTIMVEVQEGQYCDARAILSTKFMRYPMMLSSQSKTSSNSPSSNNLIELSQPAPGWPALPIPQIPFGYLVANTIPDDAEIYIDGRPVFDSIGKVLTTPASVLGIVVGKHAVTFRKKGYSDSTVEIDINNGLYSDAYAVLNPIVSASKTIINLEPAKGKITIDTNPTGAQIYIDSRLMLDEMEVPIRTPTTLILQEGWHDLGIYLENHCREFSLIYIYPDTLTYVHKDIYMPPCE